MDAVPTPNAHSRESGNPERRATTNLDPRKPPSKLGQPLAQRSILTCRAPPHSLLSDIAGKLGIYLNSKWWTARITIRLDVLLVAVLAIAASVVAASYLSISRATDDSISIPELQDTARAWTEGNINDVAGDALVEFIASESGAEQPDLFREFLDDRRDILELATTWSYCPVVSEGIYQVTATASTNLHEVVPLGPRPVTDASGTEVPIDPNDFKRIATLPFLLTVDTDSKIVTDWSVLSEEGIVCTTFGGSR